MNDNWKKNAILFLTSQAISLLGSSMVQYSIMWYITLTTQSGVMMAISIICGFLPSFFLSPFAGVWADRYNRKLLIILSDSFIALSTLVLAILFIAGFQDLWLLFAISAFRALGSGIQSPAVSAFLPQFVPENQLTKVNAANGSIQSAIMLISPMLSGALLKTASIDKIFFIDVITALLAVFTLLLFLHVPPHTKASKVQTTSYFTDMKLGLSYIKSQKYIMNFFISITFILLLISPISFLTPLQVTRNFGNDVWRLTAIEVVFSTGMIVGSLIMASWGGLRNRVYTMSLSIILVGVCCMALGIIPNFYIYLFIMCLTGMIVPFYNTPATVLLQENVDGDFQGRVFGILGMITNSIMPLGMLIFGPLSDLIKIEWLLIATGLLLIVQSFYLLGNRAIVEAGQLK